MCAEDVQPVQVNASHALLPELLYAHIDVAVIRVALMAKGVDDVRHTRNICKHLRKSKPLAQDAETQCT